MPQMPVTSLARDSGDEPDTTRFVVNSRQNATVRLTMKEDRMLNNVIVPGKSLGGIRLGEEVGSVVERLSGAHLIEQLDKNTLKVDGGVITIYLDSESGRIASLACNAEFQGNYQGKLWPGMTVGDVLKNTAAQMAWCGFVQVDGVKGMGLPLPDEFDDFERLTDFLDRDFIFNELWVYSF